jgi:PAS domain S-box-containing protein
LIGILAIAAPGTFDPRRYGDAIVLLPRYAVWFVVGGVVTLTSFATRARRPGWIPLTLAALGGLPMLGLGVAAVARGGPWPAPVIALLLGVSIPVDAARTPARRDGREPASSLAVLVAASTLVYAVWMVGQPSALRLPASAWVAGITRPLAAAMAVGVIALLVGWRVPGARAATQMLAAAPLLVLAAGFAWIGRWPGAVAYGIFAVGLAGEPRLRAALDRRVAERRDEPKVVADYEVATEGAAWGFVVMAALAGSAERSLESRQALAVLTLVSSLFTIYWFHFRSVREARLARTVAAIAVYSALVAFLVTVTGGMRSSPYFFVYTLPIIALAWTRAPETIVVPLAIPLATILTETVMALRTGGAVPVLVAVAGPRAGGLLLVSGIAYLLARRNLDEQHRTRATSLQLQTVISTMNEGLVTVDAQGRVALCNEVARTLLGIRDDVVGRPIRDVLRPRSLDGGPIAESRDPVGRALAGQRVPWERVLSLQSDGGVPLAVSATPLTDDHGAIGTIMLLRDVRAEIEIERMRDDFFFIASHELRTPLTIMKGNLEMAVEAAPEGPLRETLTGALDSVMRLIRMVNDYLDAARLEYGALPLQLEEGFLPDLVRQALQTVGPDAARKGLELVYRETAGLPAVRMNVERALQVLLNLLGNSLRLTSRGRIEVWHEVHDGIIDTFVRDTGPGIPVELQARLFTRFGQVERGLTRNSGSSGLGLYISRKLAEQMGGTVALKESAPGEGCTFVLRLPAAAASARG